MGQSQGRNSAQRGLNPPLLVQTQLDQVTNCHKLLCKPLQEPPLAGGFTSVGEQKCSTTGSNSNNSRVLQKTFSGTQTQQPVATYLRPEHLKHLPKHRVFQKWRHQRQ